VLVWDIERFGFAQTLREKTHVPRPGGHASDIRGAALAVIRAMGLIDEIDGPRT
jgi:hypothetical protein